MPGKRQSGRPRGTGSPDRFAALGDATRRYLLEQLADRDCTVTELMAGLQISQPAVSQHLKVLRQAGLVVYGRHGRNHRYRLHAEGIIELRDWLLRLEHPPITR